MFHDCGNEGNGGLTWDNELGMLLPLETGCDASILFSKEQLSIPGNQGRVVQTAEGERSSTSSSSINFDDYSFMFHRACNSRHRCVLTFILLTSVLYDNVYTHVNDELEAFQFLKDPSGRFSGASKSTKMFTACVSFFMLRAIYVLIAAVMTRSDSHESSVMSKNVTITEGTKMMQVSKGFARPCARKGGAPAPLRALALALARPSTQPKSTFTSSFITLRLTIRMPSLATFRGEGIDLHPSFYIVHILSPDHEKADAPTRRNTQ